MQTAKITVKGQVTIPKKVRKALGVRGGDSIIFLVEGDQALMKPYKKKPFLDFFGALPATREFPGMPAIRDEIHQKLSKKMTGKREA